MALPIFTGLYQIENIANGKRYIGSAVHLNARWNRHKHDLRKGAHHSKKLQRAWDKYGESSFVFTILCTCLKENLRQYEQILLDGFDVCLNGYNIETFAGSSLGRRHSPEVRKKLSEIAKRRPPISEETRARLSAAQRGRKQSPESIAKTRAALLGAPKSAETREKLSKALKGRKLTEEHKRKINPLGRKHTPETIAKMSAAAYARHARKD